MSTQANKYVIWQNGKGQWHVVEKTEGKPLNETTHPSKTRAFRNIIQRTTGATQLTLYVVSNTPEPTP